jgi:hypothetical protein
MLTCLLFTGLLKESLRVAVAVSELLVPTCAVVADEVSVEVPSSM